jgi:hypothetical protein
VSVTVRSIASVEDPLRVQRVIATQLPPRRSPCRGFEALKAGLIEDRALMLVAEVDGELVEVLRGSLRRQKWWNPLATPPVRETATNIGPAAHRVMSVNWV